MGMGQGDRQGIRGIGLRDFLEIEQGAHHESDLIFSGRADTHHPLFYATRSVLENFQSRLGRRQ